MISNWFSFTRNVFSLHLVLCYSTTLNCFSVFSSDFHDLPCLSTIWIDFRLISNGFSKELNDFHLISIVFNDLKLFSKFSCESIDVI